MVKFSVRMAVISALQQAWRQAEIAQPERVATAWSFRMSRFHVPF